MATDGVATGNRFGSSYSISDVLDVREYARKKLINEKFYIHANVDRLTKTYPSTPKLHAIFTLFFLYNFLHMHTYITI